jgi:meiotic recombination protein DMC1
MHACAHVLALQIKPAGAGAFITGIDAQEKRKSVIKVSVGSKEVDTILGGGVETCSITELYGEFRTGKTQWCHMLCVTSQMPLSHGGGEGTACYIDTEGTFRPERIKEIAARYGLDGDAVLGNIIWARIFTVDNLMTALNEVAAQFAENPFRVLIVDSIMGLFRVDYQGRGELSERQQKVGALMARLNKLADEFNIAVVVTNQVMADPAGAIFAGADNKKARRGATCLAAPAPPDCSAVLTQAPVPWPPSQPIGGHVLAHASTTRLYLKKGASLQRCRFGL